MAQITSGKIIYGRVRKDDDYGINRKSDCELSFTLAEGEAIGDLLASVSAQAIGIVHSNLQLSGAAPARAAVQVQQPAATGGDKAALAAAITDPPKPPAKEKKAKKPPAADPAGLDDAPAEKADPADLDDGLGDDLMAPAAAEITDADIQKKITDTNAAISNPKEIRALIGSYVQSPKTARDIPQKLRPEFLKKLSELKPAA